MVAWRAVLIGGLGVVAAGCRAPPPAPEPSAGEVRTALALAVGLLEARDHTGFVERFLPPDELECALACGETPAVVAAKRLADPSALLTRLRQVRGRDPAFADRGATAVFEGGGARVVFRRVSGAWYLDWS